MIDFSEIKTSNNLTDRFYDDKKESELSKLGNYVVNGYDIDEASRSDWKNTVDLAMDIARQVQSTKNFPWPKSSNIKYPLITEAAIDFASRVLPEIIPNDKIVKMATMGKDPTGEKYMRATRVEDSMSFQLINSPDWYDGVDSLLHILPVVGTAFKKTYYCPLEKRNISEVCPPDKIVVNYNTQSLETARRVTHIITLSINDVIQRQRRGIFNKNIDVESLRPDGVNSQDEDYEIEFLEQHCWYDLDDDGFREPYIITVHAKTRKVMRLVARIKKIEKNGEGQITNIVPWQYFTDFHFIKSPDGGFYSMGFGQLLLPINKAINSLINQLIDAGTLSVTQGGFLGKGLRLRDTDYKFRPFEWKVLDTAAGTDIKQNVFPFPVREPSQTLFSLLTLMIQIGKDLSSSTEAMTGNMPGQNVSSQTMNTLVEQGSKIFVAINKRFYRSQTKEYRKLYELNHYFMNNKVYQNILDDELADVKKDFELELNDVYPVADPILSSMSQKLQRAQVLFNLRTADARAIDMYMLRTMQYDDEQISQILPPPDPNAPPPPEVQKLMSDMKVNEAKVAQLMTETQLNVDKSPLDQALLAKQISQYDSLTQESIARVWKMQKDAAHGDQKILLAGGKMQQQENLKQEMAEHKKESDAQNFALGAAEMNLKSAKIQTDAILENKKLDILDKKEKANNGKD